MSRYKITRTQNTIYMDKANRPVQGYLVYVYLADFDEEHELRVPSLNKAVVEAAINDLLEQRKQLEELGK